MNYVTTTVQVCINCKLTTVHVCVNCKLTTVHVFVNYKLTTVHVCVNCKLTTVHVCVNCKLTTVHVCIYILFAVCADDGDCQNLLQTFNNTNKNLCDEPKLKYFCNESCGLCQHVAGTFIYSRNMVTMNVCCLELLFITITM